MPARALVVEGDPKQALDVPAASPVGYVAKLGGTSGVYLGEGWFVTAAHVGAQAPELGGARYAPVGGSWAALSGAPGSASAPDLGVFRVEPRPPLPRLEIARRAPKPGEPLLLVGCGLARGERFSWQERVAFRWAAPGVRRWGQNLVAATELDVTGQVGTTRVFATLFSAGEPREAQAAVGDSGGGGFVRRRGAWKLAGVMISVATFPGQPPDTAVDGNATQLADLSHYRAQILALTGLPDAPPDAASGAE